MHWNQFCYIFQILRIWIPWYSVVILFFFSFFQRFEIKSGSPFFKLTLYVPEKVEIGIWMEITVVRLNNFFINSKKIVKIIYQVHYPTGISRYAVISHCIVYY